MPADFELPGGGVALDFHRDWCARHLEPLRERWPSGAGLAMLLLFDAFARDEGAQRAAGHDPELDRPADAARLPALVAEFSPLCCYLGDDVAAEITREALAGEGPRLDAIREGQARRADEG